MALPRFIFFTLALVAVVAASFPNALSDHEHHDHHGEPGHKCIHDEIQAQVPIIRDHRPLDLKMDYLTATDGKGKRAVQAEPVWEDLRILVHVGNIGNDPKQCSSAGATVQYNSNSGTRSYTCTAEDVLTPAKRSYLIERMLVQAADRLKNLRVVRPNNGTLITSPSATTCNGDVNLPPGASTTGVNADFILLVTARPIPPANYPDTSSSSSRTLATATTCQINDLGRPTVGWANFDVSSLNPSDDQAIAMQLGVAMHEISHALGFSFSTFSASNRFKRVVNGSFVDYAPGTIFREIDASRNLVAIITPSVVEESRNHFECNNLEGLLLEPAGGSGTARSHWWKQNLFSEYMTGTASATPVFSRITLALFKDAGWYNPNMSAADPLGFGRKLGCSFANNGCPNWPQRDGYGCNNELSKSCTGDFLAYGLCNPAGTFLLPCGYYQPQTLCIYEYKSESDPTKKTINDLLTAGEEFGNQSRCFLSSLNKIDALSQIVPVPGLNTERCYRTACQSKTKLRVYVDGYHYLCDYSVGGEIKVNNFGGTVKCPPRMADNICQNKELEDPDWPSITAVVPNRAKPGTVVTIYGSNFNKTANMSALVESPCASVRLINGSALECTLAGPEAFYNPRHLNIFGDYKVVVAVKDTLGRSDAKPEAASVEVEFNLQYLQAVFLWLQRNPVWAVVGVLILVVPCGLMCFCCWRKCRKQKKPKRGQFAHNYDAYDDQYYYDEDPAHKDDAGSSKYNKPSKR